MVDIGNRNLLRLSLPFRNRKSSKGIRHANIIMMYVSVEFP